ncbi:MAG: GNAT family N-acetyltransferase, partial [Candidatus Thorarchaeota archaeon]
WLDDPLWHPIGVFVNDELVSYAAIQQVADTNYAWVNALRTNKEHQGKGFAYEAVKHSISMSKELGIKELRYATSSRNQASMNLAIKTGFELIDTVGYVRIHKPYPAHPRSSPNLIPVNVDASRVYEVISQNPELVPTSTIPLTWEFFDKDIDGLNLIDKQAQFRLVIDEQGNTQGLYCTRELERDGFRINVYSVYCQERGTFVDIISRTLEELEAADIDRSVFFLGPNATEWVKDMAILPEDWEDRNFLHYKLQL